MSSRSSGSPTSSQTSSQVLCAAKTLPPSISETVRSTSNTYEIDPDTGNVTPGERRTRTRSATASPSSIACPTCPRDQARHSPAPANAKAPIGLTPLLETAPFARRVTCLPKAAGEFDEIHVAGNDANGLCRDERPAGIGI
jgi:hypothetical protein